MFMAGRLLLGIGVTLLLVKLLPGFLLLPLLLGVLFFGFFGRRGPWRGHGHGASFPYGGPRGYWRGRPYYGPEARGGCQPRSAARPQGPRDEDKPEAPKANTGETTRL
jgi:hypothetical protein